MSQVANPELPSGTFSHQMLHKAHDSPAMGSSMVIGSTSKLAPSRFLKGAGIKKWIGYLSESGCGQRRMPGRSQTTNAELRCYTPNTIQKCRRQPAFSSTKGPRSTTVPPPRLLKESHFRQQLCSKRLVGEELDPSLLRMLLRQPEDTPAHGSHSQSEVARCLHLVAVLLPSS